MVDVQVAWPATLDLGEGPVWHAPSQQFFCVDIHGCAIHAWSPATGAHRVWNTPERIGWLIARTDEDGFMAGMQSGFYRLWLEPELRLELVICPHPGMPDVRLNDAKADPWGHIWAGSMNNEDPALQQGQLTHLDASGPCTVLERGIYIANGPAIAPDGLWMLHTDSFLNTTYRYRITSAGTLHDKVVWRVFASEEGTPDGMTFDTDGNVWIAFWGGACIRQFTPAGQLLQQIALPALQVTSMAFGGANLDVMLVTSARTGLTPQQLLAYPESGNTYVLRTGVKGTLPCTYGAQPQGAKGQA